MIVKMARVSAPSNQGNMDTAPRLLKYLINHKHQSPFEMANLCVEIETTRGISAQILRHRSFSFQEFSQRYADVGELGSSVIPHLRRQDLKNRQNSIDDLSPDVISGYYRRIGRLFEDAEHLYREMVSSGVAKECARAVLPIATKTKMYMNGTLRSWIHYLQLRCDVSTQLEHRQIAEAIKQIFCEQFPIIGEAVFDE
jgi:thymidylate synthase (FAD)